jgi:hypothetical protein
MRNAWVSKIVIVTLVGGLCLIGYGLAHAEKPIKPRFSVLSKDPAWVLDRTTSLLWQKAQTTEIMGWPNASTSCTGLGDGARLPEVKELISLVDYSAPHSAPVLPRWPSVRWYPDDPILVGDDGRRKFELRVVREFPHWFRELRRSYRCRHPLVCALGWDAC